MMMPWAMQCSMDQAIVHGWIHIEIWCKMAHIHVPIPENSKLGQSANQTGITVEFTLKFNAKCIYIYVLILKITTID